MLDEVLTDANKHLELAIAVESAYDGDDTTIENSEKLFDHAVMYENQADQMTIPNLDTAEGERLMTERFFSIWYDESDFGVLDYIVDSDDLGSLEDFDDTDISKLCDPQQNPESQKKYFEDYMLTEEEMDTTIYKTCTFIDDLEREEDIKTLIQERTQRLMMISVDRNWPLAIASTIYHFIDLNNIADGTFTIQVEEREETKAEV